MAKVSRRRFIKFSSMGFGGTIVSGGLGSVLSGCSGSDDNEAPGSFDHGVASGDPLHDRVIIWTRVTPEDTNAMRVGVTWQVARDESFNDLVVSGSANAESHKDFTLKVDVIDLDSGTPYFYRFLTANNTSATGKMKTLPEGDVSQAKFVVVSCSNYPAGYFHVYGEAARLNDVDAALHLGDYLYEYDRDGYASENAQALSREVEPAAELITLSDYRTRYAQYRSDPNLQAFHQAMPMIAVWDDHEVANDTWKEGAENHDESTQGAFIERLAAALQAYAEWMPVRPPVDTDVSSLYRNFEFGNLVNLIMLDTRLVGRDQQLQMTNYFADSGFDTNQYSADVDDTNRTLLGADQFNWLTNQLNNTATWQVLGQQVLMGTMQLPGAVATGQLSIEAFAELAQLATLAQTNPQQLSAEQLTKVQQQGALLQLPPMPYNLDAWDGYPYERNQILLEANNNKQNLVVLAGDTHNAWANNIDVHIDEDTTASAGVEFATASVSSPGLESFLGLQTQEAAVQTEQGLIQLIQNLQYANLSDRGYLTVTFTPENVTAQWEFIDTVNDNNYQVLSERSKTVVVPAGQNRLS